MSLLADADDVLREEGVDALRWQLDGAHLRVDRERNRETTAILDRASRAMAAIRDTNTSDRLAALATAAAELHRLDPIGPTAAMDELSERALGYGLDPAAVQAALTAGINRVLDERADAPAPTKTKAPAITATPWKWRDPASISRRQWLYSRHYIRKFISVTFAVGGGGKSSLGIAEALAMITARPLLDITPAERVKTWIWNGEDPQDETDRRITAAMQYHGIKPADVEGYLFSDSGRTTPITIATQTRGGTIIHAPVVAGIIEQIRRNHIGAMIIDPFVSCHCVIENDNSAVNAVAKQWAHIADVTGCAVELAHHTRKSNGAELTAEDGRGAGALLNAARVARVLNRMTDKEAEQAGIPVWARWRYFRADFGKANMTPPAETATWYKLDSVDLANGDNVGVATAWTYPQPLDGVTVEHLRAAQKAVAANGPWRADVRAKKWVGIPIAKAMGLDLDDEAHRKKVITCIKVWTKNGTLAVVTGKGDDRHDFDFVEVGKWAD